MKIHELEKLEPFDIRIGQELHQCSEDFLAEHFGKFEHTLHQNIWGNDLRQAVPHQEKVPEH